MKLNQSRLRQIIKEELQKVLKEEKYKAKENKRWEPDEPEYEKAVGRLSGLERKYPVLVGALTTKNPVTRDACIQELAAAQERVLVSGRGRLELADELAAVEKALKNVFKEEEGFYTLD